MLDSELFVFRTLKPGVDGHATCISNWFISAYSNNPILRLTQHLLYEYWKENNMVIDYYIFHDFFQLATEAYPEEWERVIPHDNSTSHVLLLRMFEKYNDAVWKAIQNQVVFHKLTYKFEDSQIKIPNTFYRRIFE